MNDRIRLFQERRDFGEPAIIVYAERCRQFDKPCIRLMREVLGMNNRPKSRHCITLTEDAVKQLAEMIK